MKTGENGHFEFLGQKVKILAYKCLIKLRRSWKLEEVHLIWRVMRVALGPTVVLTPEPTLWDVWFRRYEHFRKNFFLVKKSKFWLRSPPEAPETPEMDCNMPHWRPLNDLSPRIDQKNGKKEGRGKRDGFRWVFSGGLVGGFTLARSIYLENRKSYMTSEGGIFLVFQWGCGKICEIGQNRPRNGQKSDFLAIFGLLEALKTPYRCDLKSKLVELLMGHNLKAFRAKKIWPGWQGGSETNFGVGA